MQDLGWSPLIALEAGDHHLRVIDSGVVLGEHETIS